MQAVISQARKIGKAAYIFSVDAEARKVVHVNYVPEDFRKKGLDARAWAVSVSEIVGGKASSLLSYVLKSHPFVQAGGKEDSAQGVGSDIDKVKEAFDIATSFYARYS